MGGSTQSTWGVPIRSAKQLEFKMKFMGLVVVALVVLLSILSPATSAPAPVPAPKPITPALATALGAAAGDLAVAGASIPAVPVLPGSCWSPVLYPDLRRHPCQDRLGQGGRLGRAWSCWVGGNQKSRKFSSDAKLLSIVIKL